MPEEECRVEAEAEVWTGSSSSAAAGHNPEDLTPSHIRSDLDALHRRVKHIEEEDVRADNKRLKMMLSEKNRTKRCLERKLPGNKAYQSTFRRWTITVENLLNPAGVYVIRAAICSPELYWPLLLTMILELPYVACHVMLATAPATDTEMIHLPQRRLQPSSHKDLQPRDSYNLIY
ncbi:hypothetical protein Tco_0172676 [Tanacetum coccineum]